MSTGSSCGDLPDPKGTSDCADQSIRSLRSTGTKGERALDASAKSPAELERELETRTRELAEAREHLAEALARETATSEVLQVISSSPGGLEPVFESMLANATRICEASYGTLWLCEGGGFRAVALQGALPSAFTEQLRDGRIWHPSEAVAITRVARTLQTVQVDDVSADQGYLDRAPLHVAACRHPHIGRRADAQGERDGRCDCNLPQRSSAFH